MSNLIDIQSQIEKLQKQASEIKSKDFHATVQDILAKMAALVSLSKICSLEKAKAKLAVLPKVKLAQQNL